MWLQEFFMSGSTCTGFENKMKKLICLLTVFISFLPLFALENPYAQSMGLTSLAMTDSEIASFVNPAQTYFFDNSHSFEFTLRSSDNWGKGMLSNPGFDINGVFAAKRISVGFSSRLNSVPIAANTYNITNESELDVTAAYGFKFFSAGVGVTAGSTKVRKNLDIRHDRRLFDLIKNSFFEEFNRIKDSEYITVRAGVQFKFKQLSIGAVVNNLVDGSESNAPAWGERVNLGFFWQQDKFAERGQLKPFVLSAGVEFLKMASSKCELRAGFDATIQLVRDYTISVRAGLAAPIAHFSKGNQIISVGAKLKMIDCSFSLIFPYEKNNKDFYARANLTVLI